MQAATSPSESCTDLSLSVDAVCSAVSSCADGVNTKKNETEISLTSFRMIAAANISLQLNDLPVCVDAMSQDNGDDIFLASSHLPDFSSEYHDAAINEHLCGQALTVSYEVQFVSICNASPVGGTWTFGEGGRSRRRGPRWEQRSSPLPTHPQCGTH